MIRQPDMSNGATRFGARMGRGTIGGDTATSAEAVKVSLQRIRINSGGYDSGGAYWGLGAPLYWAGSDCGLVDTYFRAANRDEAKATVRKRFPQACFYR